MSHKKQPLPVQATLTHDVGGAFGMTWPKGTVVQATPTNRSRSLFTIRRDPEKTGSHLTVVNVMTSVPAFALGLEQARRRPRKP